MVILALIGLIILSIPIVRWLWRWATFDWFGINYDDPTSPYYHDKHGKGRGHDR